MSLQGITMIKLILIFLQALSFTLFFSTSLYADSDTATQQVRIMIPKIAIIDVDNTYAPLQITFDPIRNAGDNFSTTTAIGRYDVTSNIRGLKLYGKTDIDLQSKYNLKLEVNEALSFYRELTTSSQKVSNQNRQAQKDQPLFYRASPVSPNKTIPYGNVDVTITYTLVEP